MPIERPEDLLRRQVILLGEMTVCESVGHIGMGARSTGCEVCQFTTGLATRSMRGPASLVSSEPEKASERSNRAGLK